MDAPTQDACEKRLPRSLKAVAEAVAAREGFTDLDLAVSRAADKGDNYIGVVFRVRASGTRGGRRGEAMSFIVKCLPESEERRAFFRVDEFFSNEAFMYSEVLPAFYKLQEDSGLPDEDRFSSTARLHACDRWSGDLTVVLEDMSVKGYLMANRLKGLDAAHCSLVFKELAKFHAFSFALRDQKPQEFHRLRSKVKENIFVTTESGRMDKSYQQSIDHVESTLLKVLSADSKYVKRFREFGSSFSTLMEVISGEASEPYTVICHGDCWTNNILFKYPKDGETPVALCLLDLQTARYNSLVTDLSYFLYCCTEGSVRREAYKSLMSDYYESFSQFLLKLGSDPEKLFPYSAFQDHERKFSQFGLAMAMIALPLFTASSEDAPDLDKSALQELGEVVSKSSFNDRFLRRMTDVVVDMVDNNFI